MPGAKDRLDDRGHDDGLSSHTASLGRQGLPSTGSKNNQEKRDQEGGVGALY